MPETERGHGFGILEEAVFSVKEARIEPGSGMFLYTDGVTEAMDSQGRLYAESQLEQVLRRSPNQSPSEMFQATIDEVRAYAGETPQADDITLLALRYSPGGST